MIDAAHSQKNLTRNNQKAWKHVSEILFVLGVVSFIAALVIASNYFGVGGYQASVYDQFPPIFWFIFFSASFLGILRVLIDIALIKDGYRWMWGIGLLVALVGFLIAIPILSGYAFHGHYDSVVHYSFSEEILETGKLSEDDFYPVSHIWAADLANISGVGVQEIVLYFPLLFYLIGVTNLLFLAFVIDPRKEVRGLVVLLGVLPMFTYHSTMFYPLQFALYELWLFVGFFLLSRRHRPSQRETVIFILIIFLLPFLHPLGAAGAILLLVFHIIYGVAVSLKSKNRGKWIRDVVEKNAPAVLIILVSWFAWFSGFQAFGTSTNTLYQSLLQDLGIGAVTDRYLTVVEGAGNDLTSLIFLTSMTYGQFILFGLLLVFGLIVLKRSQGGLLKIGGSIVLFSLFLYLVGAVSFFVDLLAAFPSRYFNYGVSLLPIFIGLSLILLFEDKPFGRRLLSVLLLSIPLMGIYVIGSFNLYFSNFMGSVNHQFSVSQLEGYRFVYREIDSGSFFSPSGRTRDVYALGAYGQVVDEVLGSSGLILRQAPDHFVFNQSQLEPGNNYLVVNAYDRAFFLSSYQSGLAFGREDFLNLDLSLDFDLVYDSGDFALYYIGEGGSQ